MLNRLPDIHKNEEISKIKDHLKDESYWTKKINEYRNKIPSTR
jgi:hypothetical protein